MLGSALSSFKVQGSRLRVQGSRFKVQGSRFKVQGSGSDDGCWMLDVGCSASTVPQKARLWPLAHRHPPGPFLLTGRQSRRSLTGDSPQYLWSAIRGTTASLRRISGEARTRSGGGERAYRGRPDDSHLAAASPRFQRIPLAARHFRGRRFSVPRLRQIVAAGRNLYPGLR
jgi:hypothetical protein